MDQKATPKLKRLYWLCEQVGEKQLDLAMHLQQQGYAAQFFANAELLIAELKKQRVTIMIIGDEGSDASCERHLQKLFNAPEAQGIRLIMTLSRSSFTLASLAASSHVRDLIPLSMNSKEWIERFLFSAGKGVLRINDFSPYIAYPQIADIGMPARLTWIGDDRLSFEARMTPPVGTTISISGKFVQTLGLKRLSLTVAETRKTDLIYRFGDAITCRWTAPGAAGQKAIQLLQKMRQTDFGPKIKVFVAVHDPNARAAIINELDPLRFELNIALQKQSLSDEPRFFSPHVVFIDEHLCKGEDLKRIEEMSQHLSAETPIVLIGNHQKAKELQAVVPLRRIIPMPKVPDRLADTVVARLLAPSLRKRGSTDGGAVFIGSDHPFSVTEVHFSGRVAKAHPRAAQVQSPFMIGQYALLRIETPEFKRAVGSAPYTKATNHYRTDRNDASAAFPYVIDTQLCDVFPQHQAEIARQLLEFANDRFSLFMQSKAIRSNAVLLEATTSEEPRRFRREQKEGQFWRDLSTHLLSPTARMILGFFGFTLLALYFVYIVATTIAPNWQKSGAAYTESLKKIAPEAGSPRASDQPASDE